MKRKISMMLAALVLLCAVHPGVHKAAAAAAEEIGIVVTSNRYDLEITEPALTEENGNGTFRAKAAFAQSAAGKTIRVAVAFYLNDGRMTQCWSGVHTLTAGAEIVLSGELPEYDKVGVYFFEEDSLTPIRPAVMRMLDGQAQVTDADLTALKGEIEAQLSRQEQDLAALEQEVAQLRQELEALSTQGGSQRVQGTQLLAADYGILPGDVDMEKMNALLALAGEEHKTIRFDDGVYVFADTIHVGSNTSVVGSTDTVFVLSADSGATTLMQVGEGADNVYIAHLILQGGLEDIPATKGSRSGLRVEHAVRVNVENVEIAGFDLYGFYGAGMTSTNAGEFYKGLQITNCRFYNNYYGMCLGQRCEYSQVLNCVFGSNNVGCLNQGGNNSYVGCMFNVNKVGFQMDSKGLSNPAHGGCNGCAFNHNEKAIVVNDCTIGWIFNGCQIFYGGVELNACSGVVFDSCIFGSCALSSTNPQKKNANLISDSFFQTDSGKILAGNDGSVYVTDCLPDYVPQGDTQEDERSALVLSRLDVRNKAASVDAYFAPLTHSVPGNTPIGTLDIVVHGASGEGQQVNSVDVWLGNASSGEVTEHLVCDADMTTVYSGALGGYVLRVDVDNTYPYPVFFVMEAERTGGRGISYGHSAQTINHFAGAAPAVGDILTANNTYVPEFAVYAPEAS